MVVGNELSFRFYGELDTFLPIEKKGKSFSYFIKDHPAVKDTIEAIGVPHTEVDGIVVNGRSVGFDYQLQGNDKVKVYADSNHIHLAKIRKLKPKLPVYPKFILDVHLGKLARYLRLLGFDTLYQHSYKDKDIIQLMHKEKRIVLTRDVGLLKNKVVHYGYFVRQTDPQKQIREVVRRFPISQRCRPFAYCLECNGKIIRVSKKKILRRLPSKVKDYYNKFYICRSCRRVYWQGSHFARLNRLVDTVKNL